MPKDPAGEAVKSGQSWSLGLLFCTLGFIVCTLLTMTPLSHVPDYVIKLHFSAGSLLAGLSSWWPVRIGTSLRVQTTNGEFFLCLLLAALCCALAALYIYRRASNISSSVSRIYILLGALLAGLIYVVTPAMLSHDIIVYASYSRVLATYHANPYFTPISAFPADPFTSLNYWAKTVSAYGPIWTLICGAFGWLLSPAPEAYVLTFRLFALACHLLNIWLVGRVLVSLGRSSREVTLGMLLYAWNPLVLLESGLGGHNDVFMLTFLLLGVLLAVRAEQRGVLLSARGYLPPLVALVLGALVKFTALPVLVVYLIWLACKILRSFPESQTSIRLALRNWQPILLMLIRCALTGLATALVFYGPFWIGHSLTEIIASFKNPPSAIGAENSFMRSVIEWLAVHSDQRSNPLVRILVSRSFWDYLNYGVIAVCLIIGARRL
ncbi:MAG TPA: hypothetical protein VFN35_33840, partial [Ktedonobacteraceae bacterium]|nr:hypothetical protein [Ktedonobacteraceae bacterium]